jgi:hypothetical protein
MLVLRAAIKDRSRLADRVAGHHFLVVGVSEKSEPKVLPPASFAAELPSARTKVREDDALSLAVSVKGPAEQTKLFVLAKRGAPFDAARVRGHVEAAIAGKSEGERINAATAALTGIAPGYIDFMFRSAEGDLTCAP